MNTITKMPAPYEPKRKNRFDIILPEFLDLRSDFIIATERPSINLIRNDIEFNPISITFLDPIGPSTAQSLWKIITNTELRNFNYILQMLDPTGIVIEEWEINDCEIIKIDFGSLDVGSDELATCTLTLQPKYFKLKY